MRNALSHRNVAAASSKVSEGVARVVSRLSFGADDTLVRTSDIQEVRGVEVEVTLQLTVSQYV
jgi:hypothetical protein